MSVDFEIDYESPQSSHATSDMAFYFLRHNPDAFYEKNYEAFAKQGGLYEQLSGFVVRVSQNDPNKGRPGGKSHQRGRNVNNRRQQISVEVFNEQHQLINEPSIDSKSSPE